MKCSPKWGLRESSPESKNPAKKMGFTTNMPLFLRAFDCTMMLVNIVINIILFVLKVLVILIITTLITIIMFVKTFPASHREIH